LIVATLRSPRQISMARRSSNVRGVLLKRESARGRRLGDRFFAAAHFGRFWHVASWRMTAPIDAIGWKADVQSSGRLGGS